MGHAKLLAATRRDVTVAGLRVEERCDQMLIHLMRAFSRAEARFSWVCGAVR